MKLLEKNGENFMILNSAMISWIGHQKHRQQANIEKWDYVKLKNMCKGKQSIVKKQPAEQENTFANHKTNKGLISRI